MTAQILNAELASLVQDSKRRSPELRNAAEKSLQDLRSLSVTSESQLAADLVRRSQFIAPFLIACQSKSAKFASSGAGCLQRLAVSSALPKERLKEVVDALKECSSNGLEVQLKVLQTLPALSQNYSAEIRGDLLFGLLQICSSLQTSKQYAVSNSSAATLQQLIISLFENLEDEDEKATEVSSITSVPAENGKVQVRPVAFDAYRTFSDLCLLTEGSKPKYIKLSSLPHGSGLELIESVLSNHAAIFDSHPEQGHILRTILLPFIIRALSERQSFPISVRIMRVLSVIIRHHLAIAASECEVALSLLNHMLDPDAAPPWKRAMSMEIFRMIYSDMNLILQICSMYDDVDGKKNVIRDNLALFVRLASEKPALIGLGQQSTVPAGQSSGDDDSSGASAMDTTGVTGLIGGPPATNRESSTGISSHWSSVRVQSIDQLDKSEAPQLPETYVYSLVLTCINSLSENLARFILPLTVHKEARTKRRAETQDSNSQQDVDQQVSNGLSRTISNRRRAVPVNPLTLQDHKNFQSIRAVASIIDQSWPAVLACCSTFLYAALDNDYYRALVRSFQKFTQIAGLLRMSTPRDAFLTTLGKAAVPANVVAASMAPITPASESPSMFQNAKGYLGVESLVSPATPTEHQRKTSIDFGSPSLNARNLLCLRALLNIAIALGPTLDNAWEILCETLQQAEMIMAMSTARGGLHDARPSSKSSQQDDEPLGQTIASEVAAVQAAATRMFESTADFPNEAFLPLLHALCKLLHGDEKVPKKDASPRASPNPMQHQRRIGSFSAIAINTDSQIHDYVLALQKLGEVASLNLDRFMQPDDIASGWTMLMRQLQTFSCNKGIASKPRRLAAEILSRITQDAIQVASAESSQIQSKMQRRSLRALLAGISNLNNDQSKKLSLSRDGDLDVHFIWLEALRTILERNGESISDGWDIICDIIPSAFNRPDFISFPTTATTDSEKTDTELHFRSSRLGRAAFDTVQLVCSDFLPSVPEELLSTLVDLPFRFCTQVDDLNISLTMTTTFWQLSDFLQERVDSSSLINSLAQRDASSERSGISESPARTWIYLLHRLNTVTTDHRPEVRNTAVHTLLRIFGNYDLNPSVWSACFRYILLPAIDGNASRYEHMLDSKASTEPRNAWNETSRLLVAGFADLFAPKIDSLIRDDGWPELWKALVERCRTYLRLGQRFLHGVVYSALSKIISRIVPPLEMASADLDAVLQLWLSYAPASAEAPIDERATEPFDAYAQCFQEIYCRFYSCMLTDTLEQSVDNLTKCLEASHGAKYGTDLDTMTPLQNSTLACFEDIRSHCREAQSLLVKALAAAIALPFSGSAASNKSSENTFVAFSKGSMKLLCIVIEQTKWNIDDNLGPALVAALQSISQPIRLKYQWPRQGKTPVLWQQATTCALTILEHGLPYAIKNTEDASTGQSLWLEVVNVAQFIASADCSTLTDINPILVDEQFDIDALTTLRKVLVPSLGSPSIPGTTRRLHTSSLFLISLIHKTEPGEFPLPPEEPLRNLYDVRIGRTTKPPPNVRSQVAYFCFSELLSLTSSPKTPLSSPEREHKRIQLARAAAPYLILRAALPIKAYIADQPLRGRMPQPSSQRQELLFVLRSMRQLRSEPKAIPEVEGAMTEEKRHLVRLFPLVNRAVQVAGRCKGLARDEEILGELVGWLGDVGGEFGL